MTTETSLEQPALSSAAWLDRLGSAVIDLFFPPHCVVCHRLGAWLCIQCVEEIETISPPVCHRCGMPLAGHATGKHNASPCDRCRHSTSQLDGLLAFSFHSGPMRQAIHNLKYDDLRSLAAPLGKLMGEGWAALAPHGCEVDAIVPVPLHASRQRQRGYNQAALLARELRIYLRRPVVEEALIRTRATLPQVGLDARARHDNVRGAFECADDRLAGKRVLLVDDVCTTGSTLESACAAVQDAGALSVWAYVLARARPSDPDPD